LDRSGAAPNGKGQSLPTPAASSKAFTITPISRRANGSRGRCIDGGHPARHWTAVKLEIARWQGIAIGLAGADLRG
jgi:hypothetical protein